MQRDIRLQQGINIYYPYLDAKDGHIRSLNEELDWLIAYSLFADKLLFPPRSIFSGRYALQNLADLSSKPSLRSLVDTGALITTTTDPAIRDLRDLFDWYSGLPSTGSLRINHFPIYSRDEQFQRRVASEHVVERIARLDDTYSLDRHAVISIANEMPNHSVLVAKVSSAVEGVSLEATNEVSKILTDAYFLAGAKGNAAIVPPVIGAQSHEHFEYFYSKKMIGYFANLLQKALKRPLRLITPEELTQARTNLAIFREQYRVISVHHRACVQAVGTSLSKSHLGIRLRAPILFLHSTTATAIGLLMAQIFGLPPFVGGSAYYLGKFGWETVSKGYKINDRISDAMRKGLVKIRLQPPYTKDLLEVLESFDKGVKQAFGR